jgi:hypothetical protein|tara:strand:- start:524 stop:838 length:315 start_codon:yes stop_codon:yes gene_type:complete
MDLNSYVKPLLTEPGTKYFLNASLNKCNEIKNKYYNTVFNISIFVFLLSLIGMVLFFKYKGRLSKHEQEIKENQKREYIMSKIKNYQDTRRKEQQQIITNLPKW